MTIEQLIKKLQKVKNQKSIVLLSSDPEGNCFSKISDIDSSPSLVCKVEYGQAEIGHSELSKEELEVGYTEEDTMKDGKPCIILYP